MLNPAISLSPFTPILKPTNHNPIAKVPVLPHSSCSTHLVLHSHPRILWQRNSDTFSSSYSSSLCSKVQISASFLGQNQRCRSLIARAASVPESANEGAKQAELAETLQLGSIFGIWYLLNIYFNIYNKQVLKVNPFPATITAFQFGCGTVMILLMWGLNLYTGPKITRSQVAAILPLSRAYTLGNMLTNITCCFFYSPLKAMEPFFTVLLSALFLAERPTLWFVSSLVPIVGGVALASFTEASFNWIGFCSAMAFNLTIQSRNVFSKKVMVDQEETLDNINVFSVITIISFILLVPSAILLEGVKFSPSYLQSAANQGLNIRELFVRSHLIGFYFHAYQQVSYMTLQMVSPVSHAVGNCVKRVVVIASSVIFFQTPVSPINSLGAALALAGVFLYSRAKRVKPDPKTA